MSEAIEPESVRMSDGYQKLLERFNALLPQGNQSARMRAEPILKNIAEHPVTEAELERLAAIATASRAIPAILASHSDLAIGPLVTDNSLALQQCQALLQIAGDELAGKRSMEEATGDYSTFIDGAVERVLQSARTDIARRHPVAAEIAFTVIAMGKWGAQELNYASDIDLMFVHGEHLENPAAGRTAALALASRLVNLLSSPSFDGPGLVIDADLRPEGTMGPLSRRLGAYAAYYEKWAEPWELQALIKARPAAGDAVLGSQFAALATKLIWDTGLEVDSLRGLRRIKARTEDRADPSDIKRAPGGIRDIEFTVQMLQLVHGRHDPTLRVRSTLDALRTLKRGEFITPAEEMELEDAYRFLRRLEHLIQLWGLRQTHNLPPHHDDRTRLAGGMGLENEEALMASILETRSAARTLHERIYFRPVLDSMVGSPSARLGPDRAGERLSALGFGNPEQARISLESLTTGLDRRSRAMQQMLPLMLDWLSLSPDPDLGLSQLRLLLSKTSDHSSLVARLLNNPTTGERLAMLLGTGQLFGDLMDRIPEFVPRLDQDTEIDNVRSAEDATSRLTGLLASRPDLDVQIGTIRRFARRRRLRIAARDVLRNHDTFGTIRSLADSADAAIAAALSLATTGESDDFLVVAMGRWGGGELSYGSDLDLMYLFDRMDRDAALAVPGMLHRILTQPGKHGEGYDLDAGLRPEGKNGPIARSVDSTLRYYEEWAEPWELMALIRARPVAGHQQTIDRFNELKEKILWRGDLDTEMINSIRIIKARVETERISPYEDADFHLKLGPGSLSDIEFLTQLLQLIHGRADDGIRIPGTVPALQGLLEAGYLSAPDHLALIDSYEFCSKVRLRLHLQRGRLIDSLPTDPRQLSALSASLGYDRSLELREAYRRVTRRARRVFVRRFYE